MGVSGWMVKNRHRKETRTQHDLHIALVANILETTHAANASGVSSTAVGFNGKLGMPYYLSPVAQLFAGTKAAKVDIQFPFPHVQRKLMEAGTP